MANAGTVNVKFKATGIEAFKRKADEAAGSTAKFGGNAKKAQVQVAQLAKVAAAATAAAAGMVMAISKVANAAGDFGYELARAGAITKASAEDMRILEQAALKAGIATQFSPREAAEGLGVLGSMGLSAAASAHFLTSSLDLAAAGMISVRDAASSVIGMYRIYNDEGETAASITNKLVEITSMSGYQAQEFAASLGKAASKTKGTGQTFNTVLITLGLMRNSFIDAASAGTHFSRAVTNLTSNVRAQATMNKLGVRMYDKATGEARQFTDVTLDLIKAMKKYTPEARAKMQTDLFGARAKGVFTAVEKASIEVTRKGVRTTLRGAAAIAEMNRRLDEQKKKAADAAKVFRERLLGTFKGQQTLLKGTLETLAIVVGKPFAALLKPIVGFVTDSLNKVAQVIMNMNPAIKKMAAAGALGFAGLITMLAGVASAALAVGVAMKMGLGASLVSGLGALAVGIKAVGVAMSGLMLKALPIIVILGIVALMAGLLYESFQRNFGLTADEVKAFRDFFVDAFESIVLFLKGFAIVATENINTAVFYIREMWHEMWASMGSVAKAMADTILQLMNKFTNLIMKGIGKVVEGYAELLRFIGQDQKATALEGLMMDLQGFDADWAAMFGLFQEEYVKPVKKELGLLADDLGEWGANLGEFMGGWGKDVGHGFLEGFEMSLTGLKKLSSKVQSAIAEFVPDVPGFEGEKPTKTGAGGDAAKKAAEAQANRIGGVTSALSSGGQVGALASGIMDAAGMALGPVGGAVASFADQLMGMSKGGKAFQEDVGLILQSIAELFGPLFNALRPFLEIIVVLVDVLRPLFDIVTSLIDFALRPFMNLLGGVALVLKNVIIGLRAFYIAVLTLADMIPGIDFTQQIQELTRAQNREVRERNELIRRMTRQETLDDQRARRERDLAAATREATTAMLNVPSGYKVARVGFGAEAPVMDDFIMRPGQPAQQFSGSDTIVGTKNGAGTGTGTTIIIQNLDVRANNPSVFFNRLMKMVNADERAGGVSLGGAWQGRL
jgi:TP901 family phage tail tape measure protein